MLCINLLTLLWSDGRALSVCDFRALLVKAKERGLVPRYVLPGSWYGSLANLKLIRSQGWHWLTQLKSNHLVNPDGRGNRPLNQVAVAAQGQVVHLKGYGAILVFQTVTPNGDVEYWATSDLAMEEEQRQALAKRSFQNRHRR